MNPVVSNGFRFWNIRIGIIFVLIVGWMLLLAPLPVAASEPAPVIHVTDQPVTPTTLRISASQPIQFVNVLAQPVEIEIVQQQFRVYLPLLVGSAGSPANADNALPSVTRTTRVRLEAGQTLPYSFIQPGVYTLQLIAVSDSEPATVLATVVVSAPAPTTPAATATSTAVQASPTATNGAESTPLAEPTDNPPFGTEVVGTVEPTPTDPVEVLPTSTAVQVSPTATAPQPPAATKAATSAPAELNCGTPHRTEGWRIADIGTAQIKTGKTVVNDSTILVCGTGVQMWGNNDGLRLTYQQRSADITLVARVDEMVARHAYTKVGLTLRNSTEADAAHVSVMLTQAAGIRVQWRSTDGNGSTDGGRVGPDQPVVPTWLKLVRTGTTVQAYFSTAATPAEKDWLPVGSAITIELNQSVLAGLFVSSRSETSLSSALFSNVALTGLDNPPVPSTVPPTARPTQAPATARPTQAPATARPTQAPVQVSGHPRIFVTASELPALRERARGSHRFIYDPIERYARSQIASRRPTSRPANELDAYRNAGNRMAPFAFACLVSQDEQLCTLAKDYLLAHSGWSHWDMHAVRDLGLAQMLQGNALAYDWLYPRLSESERQRVRATLAREAGKMYEASLTAKREDWNNWWPHSYMQNHYLINHATLGMVGLVLLDEVPEARTWVTYATERVARTTSLMDAIDDGSWHEGLSYQQYGLSNGMPFLLNLERLEGIDVVPDAYLDSFGDWRVYNSLPNTSQFILAGGNFEWGWVGGSSSTNLLRLVAARYGDRRAEWLASEYDRMNKRNASDHNGIWQVFEFFYYDPAITPQAPDAQQTDMVFRDAEAVIWRTGWGADDLVFGFKSGVYGGRTAYERFVQGTAPYTQPCSSYSGCQLNIGHDHLDTNTFYLARGNNWLAPERHGYGKDGTAYHNTILIDGKGQYEPNPRSYGRSVSDFRDSDGRLEVVSTSGKLSYLRSDATRRYKNIGGIEEVRRHVVFVRPAYLLMLDELAARDAHSYVWKLHADRSITRDGNWLRSSGQDDQVLGIAPLTPASWNVSFGNNGKPFAEISPVQRSDDVRLVHLLYPTTGSAWASRPTARVTADTGQALHVRVTFADGSYDDVLIAYNQTGSSSVQVSGYTLTGNAAVVRYNASGQQIEQHVVGGTLRR